MFSCLYAAYLASVSRAGLAEPWALLNHAPQMPLDATTPTCVWVSAGKAHVPYGKDGDGLYSAATLGCFNVVQAAAQDALEACQSVRDRPWQKGLPWPSHCLQPLALQLDVHTCAVPGRGLLLAQQSLAIRNA